MSIYEELEVHIKALTTQEKMFLAKYVSPSEITSIFNNMRETIAEEAKSRTQSKIATTFNKGYGTGALFSSIYYSFDGDSVKISSTKSYFAILNQGYSAFDMKDSLAGKNVKMRLPGGRVIYRRCGPDNGNPKSRKAGVPKSNNNWIHPGYKGAHIDEIVQKEMETFVEDLVKQTVLRLINIAKSRNAEALNDLMPGNATEYDISNNLIDEKNLTMKHEKGRFGSSYPTLGG